MKRKLFFFGLISVALVMFLAGCPNTTNSGDPPAKPDTSVLEAGISAAEAAKAGVLTGEKAEVAVGMAYVAQTSMNTLDAAITAAKAVRNNGSATQADVNDAVTTLAAAVQTFSAAIKTDGEKTANFTADELSALIAVANAAKQGVEISANGADKRPSVYWVTQTALNTFNAAIDAAKSDSLTLDARYAALVAAINTFKAAQQPGTRAKTVTITGLPASANGAAIQTGLFETKSVQGVQPTVMGSGDIQNGAATLSLQVISAGTSWAGTGDWYVGFLIEGDTMIYITKTAKSFAADTVTVALSECDRTAVENGDPVRPNQGEKIGEIKGTINLTNIPSTKPSISINAHDNNYNWSSYHNSVSLGGVSGNSATNIAFAIPVYEQDSNGSLQGQSGTKEVVFGLYVSFSGQGYNLEISGSKTLNLSSMSSMDVGNIGSVSLASVTLSGTITASNAEQPIPYLSINAYPAGGGSTIGYTSVQPTAVTAQWTMTIPAQQGSAITFGVYGYDSPNGGNQLFSKTFSPDATKSVMDQSISGIVLDAGDISVGRMSGTVSFTGALPADSEIRISARYGSSSWINGGNSVRVAVSGATGTWTMPGDDAFLAALDGGSQTVVFQVRLQPSGGNSTTLTEVPRTIANSSSLVGIDLGAVNVGTVTLSGTITVSNAGQPIPYLSISAYPAEGQSNIGYASVQPTGTTVQWTMIVPVQQGGAVTFGVYGYDSPNGGNQLFSKTFAPAKTNSVTNQSISGIALDAGDIGVGRMSGTVTFANLSNPPPNRIYLSARWYDDADGSNWVASGSAATMTGNAWSFQQDTTFLEALESGDKKVMFYVSVQINQGENSVHATEVEKWVSKDTISNFDLGTITLPTLIKLSGTFSGTYNGSMPYYTSIIPAKESGQSLDRNAPVYASSGTAWAVYIPAQESATRLNFNVTGYDEDNNTLFRILVSPLQTASVFNQDVSGIVIDPGDIVPNTLRVSNPPSGSYTAYVASGSIDQFNYNAVSQPGNHRASGSGSGSPVSLTGEPGQNGSSGYVLITAGATTKYSSWVSFYNGIGSVDWNAMTEAVGSKLTITGSPPPGQLTAYIYYSGNIIDNTNYTIVLSNYSATGSGSDSPIPLVWRYPSSANNNAHQVLIKNAADEYWYKNNVSFNNGAGTISWGDMTKITEAQQLPAPANLRVTGTTADSISLSWNSVSGATYTVYRSSSSSGSYSSITTTSSASYTDSGLSAGTYYYKVSASSGGQESGQSDYAVATVSDGGGGDGPGGGDTLAGAKGKLTLTGFSEFNGKYVYSALVTTSGKYLIGTNAVTLNGSEAVISMVPISGGTAEVPLYTTNVGGTDVADIYVPYEGSEGFQVVSIIIVDDADGKFTASDAVSFATSYAAIIGNNTSNTGFTPSTSSGSITISRSDVMTMDEMLAAMAGGDYTIMQTVKYMLMTP